MTLSLGVISRVIYGVMAKVKRTTARAEEIVPAGVTNRQASEEPAV
jgi:hypothetical protein